MASVLIYLPSKNLNIHCIQIHKAILHLYITACFSCEMSGVYSSNVPDNYATLPGSFSMMQCNIPLVQYDGYLGNILSAQTLPPMQEFVLQPQYSLMSNNSPTSDEADDHHQQHNVADERKQRRMISNKESARRSRMRKQQLFDELRTQVMRLRNENHNLVERLNSMSVASDKLVEENSKLKEESSDLRQMLTSLQIGSPPYISFRISDKMPCNSHYPGAASSTQSMNSSVDLLH